ncbi:MAG TPA: glycosyltransferase [Vicinamibacterales bacterium]
MSLVSVIIPAHNAGSFLYETISSALAQTWPHVEVIVVNDGSTDATAAVAASFGDRIRVINQPQSGVAVARNRGAAVARGAWLAFLDADDLWLPHKLATQMAAAGDSAHFIYSDRFNIGHFAGLPRVQGDEQYLYEGDIFAEVLAGNVITTSSVLIRRAAFEALGGFSDDPALPPAEDWDLWIRVAERYPLRVCREPLVKYRLHPSSASHNAQRMNRARVAVVERGMRLPAAAALSPRTRRRIWSLTLATNGWDAGRHGKRTQAIDCYLRAIARWPFAMSPYRELVKACVGR